MTLTRATLVGASLLAATSFFGCTRAPEGATAGSGGSVGSAVTEDVKGVAKATEKAAKDLGRATVDLGDKARKNLEDTTNKAGGDGQDAWLTTKVKGELTRVGLDPLHVHVDTDRKIVTLSGVVESAADARKAVSVATGVKDVLAVRDHLFVKPPLR